jgi:hypothetical protein
LLPQILREGLKPGPDGMPPRNVVWLDAIGAQPRVPRQLGDEACRLTVDIKDSDKRLVRWSDWEEHRGTVVPFDTWFPSGTLLHDATPSPGAITKESRMVQQSNFVARPILETFGQNQYCPVGLCPEVTVCG